MYGDIEMLLINKDGPFDADSVADGFVNGYGIALREAATWVRFFGQLELGKIIQEIDESKKTESFFTRLRKSPNRSRRYTRAIQMALTLNAAAEALEKMSRFENEAIKHLDFGDEKEETIN